MKIVSNILATLAILAGIASIGMAFMAISILSNPLNSTVSAVQITQVYSEGIYYAGIATASFLFAIAVLISNLIGAVKANTETIQFYGNEE